MRPLQKKPPLASGFGAGRFGGKWQARRWPWRVTGSRLVGFRVVDNTGETVLGVHEEREEAQRVAALFNEAYLHYNPRWMWRRW